MERKSTMTRLQQTRVVLIVLVILAVIALIAQNTETAVTRFLFMEVEMPRAALLLISFLGGLVTGILIAGRMMRRKAK